MNRRQKIIISVTGIFLVLLIIVGLTYAYFLTKINGNENTKSISISTANLALVYGDGNGIISAEKIQPGTTLDKKKFTVSNEGNDTTDYVVVIEDVKVKNVSNGSTTTFESNDFVYTLTCTEGCNGVDTETTFPITGGILVGNSIEVGKTHTYELTVTYKETGLDQSNDMNKSLEAKVNISDISTINPYSDNTNSLAYNIINNAIGLTTEERKFGYAELLATPKTDVAEEISIYDSPWQYGYETKSTGSLCAGYAPWLVGTTASAAQSGSTVTSYDMAVGKYVYDQCEGWTMYLDSYYSTTSLLIFKTERPNEKALSVTQDDYGTSYYYRGAVKNNYLEFNNMCWRIVRIEGDDSIKIILAAEKKCSEITDSDAAGASIGDYGYIYDYVTNSSGVTSSSQKYVADYENSVSRTTSIKYKLDEWLINSEIDTSKLKKDEWCLGNITDAYDTSTGTLLTDKVNDLMYNSKSFNYDTLRRLDGVGTTAYATLRCDGKNYETYESYIGALTVDEVVFAGGKVGTANKNYYLTDNATKNAWWTLSLSSFGSSGGYDSAFMVYGDGNVGYHHVDYSSPWVRPALTLASNTIITGGNGTKTNPYVVG